MHAQAAQLCTDCYCCCLIALLLLLLVLFLLVRCNMDCCSNHSG
jgi:hypothetical protein